MDGCLSLGPPGPTFWRGVAGLLLEDTLQRMGRLYCIALVRGIIASIWIRGGQWEVDLDLGFLLLFQLVSDAYDNCACNPSSPSSLLFPFSAAPFPVELSPDARRDRPKNSNCDGTWNRTFVEHRSKLLEA